MYHDKIRKFRQEHRDTSFLSPEQAMLRLSTTLALNPATDEEREELRQIVMVEIDFHEPLPSGRYAWRHFGSKPKDETPLPPPPDHIPDAYAGVPVPSGTKFVEENGRFVLRFATPQGKQLAFAAAGAWDALDALNLEGCKVFASDNSQWSAPLELRRMKPSRVAGINAVQYLVPLEMLP